MDKENEFFYGQLLKVEAVVKITYVTGKMLHEEAFFHSTACSAQKGVKREKTKPNLLKFSNPNFPF